MWIGESGVLTVLVLVGVALLYRSRWPTVPGRPEDTIGGRSTAQDLAAPTRA